MTARRFRYPLAKRPVLCCTSRRRLDPRGGARLCFPNINWPRRRSSFGQKRPSSMGSMAIGDRLSLPPSFRRFDTCAWFVEQSCHAMDGRHQQTEL